MPDAYVGQTIYLKFTSLNIYGGAEEDISTVPAYNYIPTGKGGYIAPPTDLLLSFGQSTGRRWHCDLDPDRGLGSLGRPALGRL